MEDKEILRSIWNFYEGHNPEKGDKTALYNEIQDPESEYNNMPALHFAATYADAEGIRILLAKGADPNVQSESMQSNALHVMAYGRSGNYKMPEGAMKEAAIVLIEAGTSALRKNVDHVTCTHIAARDARHELVAAVAEMNKKLDMTDNNGNTPLHLACDYARHASESFYKYTEPRHKETMAKVASYEAEERILKEHKESSQRQYDRDRKKMDDYFVTIKILMDNGLDPDQKNNSGETAKSLATKCMDIRISALVNGTYSEDGSEESILIMKTKGMDLAQAVLNHDHDALEALLKLGNDPNVMSGDLRINGFDAEGKYPLGCACATLDLIAVDMLLAHGADPSLKDSAGRAPILYSFTMMSSFFGGSDVYEKKVPVSILKSMIDKGMDINGYIDDKENTILNLACYAARGGGSYNGESIPGMVLNAAIRMKADVNLSNNEGVTPLMWVCEGGNRMEGIQLTLLEAGAEVGAKDKNGNTPLMYAASSREKSISKTMAEMLFEFGDPKVNAVNNEGKSALEIATEKDKEEFVKFLLQRM